MLTPLAFIVRSTHLLLLLGTNSQRRAMAAARTSDSSDLFWDQVVQDLEKGGGLAVVKLTNDHQPRIHQAAFGTAKHALDALRAGAGAAMEDCPRIRQEDSSAHATGHHSAGGMSSRYNQYREGFVFSNGNHSFPIKDIPNFQHDMEQMFLSLHDVAQRVLSALERKWNLPNQWFQDSLGDTRNHSQWHIKRYVRHEDEDGDGDEAPTTGVVVLPTHTDPSLISILVHDAPHIQKGGLGLEYQSIHNRVWTPIPYHGHSVVTILVGSVLAYMTGMTATKHRVVTSSTTNTNERMAATLFVRPRGTAMLTVPPSTNLDTPLFSHRSSSTITFDVWNARVSRNYMKSKPPE